MRKMKIEEIQDIIYEKENNGICTATISIPKRRNAMSAVTFLELYTIINDMEQDKNAKVLIITGDPKGRAFTSGGYISSNFMETVPKHIRDEIEQDDPAQKKLAIRLFTFYKPIIAVINGLGIGGGITMPLLGADLIYMAEDAYVWFNFAKRAFVPEFSCSFTLVQKLGFQKAKEILYLADKITAQQAFEIGLVNKVLPKDELMLYAREQALKLIPPKGSAHTISLIKKSIHSHFIPIVDKTLDLENEGMRKSYSHKDIVESALSLREKREPHFSVD
ncbi:MAG: enoyl-CoA hydratase-related protein [Promethearchaeota archaeon]